MNKKDKKKKTFGIRSIVNILVVATFLTCVLTLIIAFSWLHTWNVFTTKKKIADVKCEAIDSQLYQVELTQHGLLGAKVDTFTVQGDEWYLEGIIIEYKPWVYLSRTKRVAGVRLTRIGGRFLNYRKQGNCFALDDEKKYEKMMKDGGENYFYIRSVYGRGVYQLNYGQYPVWVDFSGFWPGKRQKG